MVESRSGARNSKSADYISSPPVLQTETIEIEPWSRLHLAGQAGDGTKVGMMIQECTAG